MKIQVSVGSKFIDVLSFNITKGIGRGYNVATISTMDESCNVNEELQIIIDGIMNRFIIYSISYGKNKTVTIEARGLPSILENETYGTTEVLSYANSEELIDDSRGIIEVISNLPLIDFKGQVYVKQNTPISRILDMVNVVLGDAYEYNDVLYLDVFKTISDNDDVVVVDDITYEYTYTNTIPKYVNIGKVYINYDTDNVYSETNIILQQDVNNFNILFNPSLTSNVDYIVEGLTVEQPRTLTKTETYSIVDTFYIKTIGGIDSVVSMLLNGEPFTNYILNTPTNIIEFTENISGTITLTYTTKGLYGEVYKSGDYVVKYACKILSDYITVTPTENPDCINTLLEGIGVNLGGIFNFSQGLDYTFIFAEDSISNNIETLRILDLVGGGKLTIKYRYTTKVDTHFIYYISNEPSTTILTKTDTVYYDDILSKYVIKLNDNMTSINSVHYGSLEILDYILDGNILVFDSSYQNKTLEISYNIDTVKVTIPPILMDSLKFLDVVGCDNITTYDIATDDMSDELLCKLPARFDVDVAGSFGLSISNVVGQIITNDTLGNFIVDSRGKITVELHSQGTYVLNCDTIIPSAEIYIDSQGVAYA